MGSAGVSLDLKVGSQREAALVEKTYREKVK
jgi:hypothetical protein